MGAADMSLSELGPNMAILKQWQNWLFVVFVLVLLFVIFHFVAKRD